MIDDPIRAGEFLTTRFDDVSGVTHLAAGAWSTAFAFRAAGRDLVVRFGAYVEDFAKDRLAARHTGPTLPIPPVLEIGEAFGGYYAVSQRVYGSYIDDADGVQMRSLLPSLFAALDAMRLADLSGTQGYGGWGADGHAPYASWQAALLDVADDRPDRRTHGWRARLAASAVGVQPFDRAYARLQTLLGDFSYETRHLIHSDLLHYNVLVAGEQISGVLDWGCGLYGDFLYDLAWLCFWQPWYPAWQGIDFAAEARRHYAKISLEVPYFEQRLRCCQLHIGLDGQAYMAYAGHWDDLTQTAQRTLDVAA